MLLLLHVPPPMASVNVTGEVMHKAGMPDMAGGAVITVTVFDAAQPVGSV
jgi:hypothetical protein